MSGVTVESRRTGRFAALLAFAVTAMAIGSGGSAEPIADPRLKVVDYQPTLVLPLTAFVGYHVHFEFAPGEFFINLGAGDTSSLDVGAEGNHLLIKPKQPTGGTNLTIITNRRVYFIDFRAVGRAPHPNEAVYSVAYRYPPTDGAAEVSKLLPAEPVDRLIAPRPTLNTDYWFCGSPSLRPIGAVDDGLQLRLTFAPQAELPAVFAAEPDGAESLVNTHVENDSLVVHRLAARLVLRRGREAGCVVDRSSRAHDRRAANGTVDPAVDRSTRESAR